MELWDLYTQDRQPTGLTMVRGSEHPQGYYRLVVHVCIFNSKGQMLIQQRQPFKEGWPNMWDVSVGGSVVAGESSREAAEREVAEELGLLDKVMNDGWKSLSAKETGRIGGLVTKRKREMRNMEEGC